MKVNRRDIFTFMVELDESNFARLKVKSDTASMELEDALELIIVNGIERFEHIDK